MSKASEYAEAITAYQLLSRPSVNVSTNGDELARVLNSGFMNLTYQAPVSPKDAMTLAWWIIDTFGEKESASMHQSHKGS